MDLDGYQTRSVRRFKNVGLFVSTEEIGASPTFGNVSVSSDINSQQIIYLVE